MQRIGIFALASCMGLAACGERFEEAHAPTAPGASVLDRKIVPSENIRPEEAALFVIEKAAPGFGGFYVDRTGTIHAYAIADANDQLIESAMQEAFLGGGYARNQEQRIGRVVVERGQYTITQLAEWRDLLFDAINNGELPEAVSLDLAEQRNRVGLFVESSSGQSKAKALVDHLGIPESAVVLQIERRPVDSRRRVPPVMVDDQADTVVGGIGISNHLAFSGAYYGLCTVGFTLNTASGPRFVTASHCTETQWSVQGSYARNALWGRTIGYETSDPGGYTCGLRTCRGSDAAMYTYSSGIASQVGLIAKMSGLGSLAWDTTSRYWKVSDFEAANMYVGLGIYKQGRTTGLTYGYVTDTCRDHMPGPFMTRTCQTFGDAPLDGGDSGGPVFWPNGDGVNTVTLAGVTSAMSVSGYLIFSSYNRVRTDLSLDPLGYDVRHPDTWPTAPDWTGSLSSGSPVLTWSAVPGATAYHLYRTWYRYDTDTGSGPDYLGTVTSPYTDTGIGGLDAYTGTTFPNFSTPGYVFYQMFAVNAAGRTSPPATIKYFRFLP